MLFHPMVQGQINPELCRCYIDPHTGFFSVHLYVFSAKQQMLAFQAKILNMVPAKNKHAHMFRVIIRDTSTYIQS